MIHKKAFDELDVDEVLKHYGYKPEEIHCNGISPFPLQGASECA